MTGLVHCGIRIRIINLFISFMPRSTTIAGQSVRESTAGYPIPAQRYQPAAILQRYNELSAGNQPFQLPSDIVSIQSVRHLDELSRPARRENSKVTFPSVSG